MYIHIYLIYVCVCVFISQYTDIFIYVYNVYIYAYTGTNVHTRTYTRMVLPVHHLTHSLEDIRPATRVTSNAWWIPALCCRNSARKIFSLY